MAPAPLLQEIINEAELEDEWDSMGVKLNCESFFIRKYLWSLGMAVVCPQLNLGQSCPSKQCVEDLVCMGGSHLNPVLFHVPKLIWGSPALASSV